MQIELFDHKNVDRLVWPENQAGETARTHLLPFVKEGVNQFISNVDTQLYLLHLNTNVLPVTVNAREYENSYLTSNYFPVKYLEEQLSKRSTFLNPLYCQMLKGAGLFLKGIKINKVVIVNNWLLTTNIYPQLSDADVVAITEFLVQRFPDHALIFRSLNTCTCGQLLHSLEKQHYRRIFARNVCIYDPKEKENLSSKVLYHHRRDRRLISDLGYEIVRQEDLSGEEVKRLLHLYGELYLKRHTAYSPHFTEKFLKESLAKKLLKLVALKKKDNIDGVIGFYEREGTLIAPFCGYEHSADEAGRLYRMLTILAIDEAENRHILLNDGSGGEAPKQFRGMKQYPEYIALYDRHLPLHRRSMWKLAASIQSRMSL